MPSITIYTKGWCPYCGAAKKLLEEKGAACTEIDIEKKPEARARLKGKRVLLIDDVLTTGATANAAARALLRGGAASVDVLAFARVVTDA